MPISAIVTIHSETTAAAPWAVLKGEVCVLADNLKVAILAGGKGTRLAEETEVRPKPMVEIGGRPILWHILMHYSHYGFTEFAVALGYKGSYIKRWVRDHFSLGGDLTIETGSGKLIAQRNDSPDWTIHLVETGIETQTGGRIKRLQPWLGDRTFMLTWGDGLSNVDLRKLLAFHRQHGKLATLTSVRPPARYGHLEFDGDRVCRFTEKPQTAEGWINGAFFVLEPGVFDYIDGDSIVWEKEPLERLAADGQLMAYRHTDFWQCMDTLRERYILETLWQQGRAPWKVWN
jgi:glucose-1-phosphate cytidylyltransferase